ncbi:hypothetical protein BC937DRAFT_95399 [Endogone sp. FLAS-F59071]|nr:hypothetical protein BC937DRAFT_95399 [Endogone sp. FLAS-F59071]|eukprot:RUS20350.1 hypothetical protein BC937DRAFT_95399 [Endogone sp. FLAS-F59071]
MPKKNIIHFPKTQITKDQLPIQIGQNISIKYYNRFFSNEIFHYNPQRNGVIIASDIIISPNFQIVQNPIDYPGSPLDNRPNVEIDFDQYIHYVIGIKIYEPRMTKIAGQYH